MTNPSNKKVTKQIKNRIVELHLQNIVANEISMQLYQEGIIDLAPATINKIIREYYDSIGQKRIKRAIPKTKTVYTVEEIEEQLLQQLQKGRPVRYVYRVAQRMGCLTDKLLTELKSRGYSIPDVREEGNEKWTK